MQHHHSAGSTSAPVGLRADLLASIVVCLVALPLCMGIAMASGLPASAGLLCGVVGGIVVGALGGSPLQVSGPAAGLTVIIWEIVQELGIEWLGAVVLLAGGLQLLAGILRLGQWFRAVSPAVIQGMLAGIGVLIFASQFHIMVDDAPRGSGIANLLSIPESLMKGIVPRGDSTHDDAARIGLLTIAILLLWKPYVPRWLKRVPPALVAVVTASIVAAWLDSPIRHVAMPENLSEAIRFPIFPNDFPRWITVLTSSASVAFIASAETLLCASAVDRLHSGPRTQYDRELGAQGIGNLVCGLIGALPMTGVIVRSAANIEAGARSRASAVLHGVWLLALLCLCPGLLRWVPTASLAGLLVYTGYKLIDPTAIRRLYGFGKGEIVVYASTLIAIVLTDLLTGVLVGMAASLAKLIWTISHLSVRLVQNPGERHATLHLRGAATFVRLPKLAAPLERLAPGTQLYVHLEELDFIDHACLDLFMSWEKQQAPHGGCLIIDWDGLRERFHPLRQNGTWVA
jgi:MFS superfamily sulfate permease-like transporter